MMQTILGYAQDVGNSYTFDIFNILVVVGLWKMFQKAGQDGWPAIIPLYNEYKLCEIVMGDPWYWLRLFVFIIPVVGWVAGIYFAYQISKATAKAFGKPDSWAIGYLLLGGIFYCITGFGDAEYYGPMGTDDHRTGEARGARTVNFDVIKNEPEMTREAEAGAEEQEETVDFFFDQPEE